MDSTLFSFSNIKIDDNFLQHIWTFSPALLSTIDSLTVSQYSIALAQYLVYFTFQKNQTKADLSAKKRLFDSSVLLALNKEVLKQHHTKTAAVAFLICTNAELSQLDIEIHDLQYELIRLEGMDKSISEYIATFKRELTRREKELQVTRQERY